MVKTSDFNYKIIPKSEFKIVLWKNGRGMTTELMAVYSEKSPNFIWRISIAGVVNNGEFSDFSGYDRYLMLLEGNGMLLDHGNGKKSELRNVYDIAHFAGNWKTTAKLIQGPIKDFNVMTHNDFCSAEIDVIKNCAEKEISVNSDHLLIYSPESTISFNGMTLNNGDLLNIFNSKNCKIKIKGKTVLVIKIFN